MFWDELAFKCFIGAISILLFAVFFGNFTLIPLMIVLVVIGLIIITTQDKIEKRKYGNYKAIAVDEETKEKNISENEWKCPKCGTLNSKKYCKECGTEKPIIVKEKYCKNCGTKLKETQKFCGKCGV